MAKRTSQRKGVFCLETASWEPGIRDRSSIEHVLRLLETTQYKVPYLYFDVATREEFDFYLKKWAGRSFAETTRCSISASMGRSRGALARGETREPSPSWTRWGTTPRACRGRVITQLEDMAPGMRLSNAGPGPGQPGVADTPGRRRLPGRLRREPPTSTCAAARSGCPSSRSCPRWQAYSTSSHCDEVGRLDDERVALPAARAGRPTTDRGPRPAEGGPCRDPPCGHHQGWVG